MVDQLELSCRIHLGIKRHLGIGRPALDQRPARIVAHPADHRRPDAARPDHRMGFAPERPQRFLQPVERCPGQCDYLAPTPDRIDPGDPHDVDDDDGSVIPISERRRSTGQPRIGRLDDNRYARFDARLERPPLLDQRPRPHHRQHLPIPIPIPLPIPPRRPVPHQHMPRPGNRTKSGNQSIGHTGKACRLNRTDLTHSCPMPHRLAEINPPASALPITPTLQR